MAMTDPDEVDDHNGTEEKPLEPLKIKCTSSACGDGLHCFRATQRMRKENKEGRCRSCGVDLIDWPRVHRRSIRDVGNTFASLRREMIRHYYWHLEIDERARRHARRKGRGLLREAVAQMLRKKVAPATPPYDGRQTPRDGNVIFYAQHAVAACCRTCIEVWHGIPRGREVAPDELRYLGALCQRFIDERLPDLTEGPEKVAALRRSSAQ